MAQSNTVRLVVALACAGLAAAPAFADPAFAVRQVWSRDPSLVVRQTHVGYGDLDPATAAGARALMDRIEAAAAAVCEPPRLHRTSDEVRWAADCRAEAVDRAVRNLGGPALAAAAADRKTRVAER